MVDAITHKKNFLLAVLSLVAIALVGNLLGDLRPEPTPSGEIPAILRVGVLPDQAPEALRRRYSPLVDYLATQTGAEVRLIIPADYYEAIRLFSENSIDLAHFGGLTFVQAQAHYGAVPLVMRNIDTRFTSWFLVQPELGELEPADLKDKTFSFGSKLSTSGHLMPRHFLQKHWQIEPEAFFSNVSYSGAHDKTALMVRDGQADVGVANSAIVKEMIVSGLLEGEDLHVLWQTPPFPDYVWAVQKHLGESARNQLRDAFLRLDSNNPDYNDIMAALNAKSFLPADPLEFTTLAEIAGSLGLMDPATR